MEMKKKIMCVIFTVFSMSFITAVLLFITAFLLFKLEISDGRVVIGIVVTYFFSCFTGGCIYGKVKEKNKYLYGIIIGMIYFLILLLISLIFSDNVNVISVKMLYSALTCVLGGMIGGMFSK